MSWQNEYRDLATPKLKAILAGLSPQQRRAMNGRLGKEIEVQLKRHFLQRDQDSPNTKGFPRSHFWAREVRAKTALRSFDADSATVGVASAPFAHKLSGGTIRPGPGKKLLSIPLRGEAYGVYPRAGTIPGLFFKKMSGGKMYLAARDGQALRVYWRLVPSVTIPADPRALPPAEQLRAALEARAVKEVQRISCSERLVPAWASISIPAFLRSRWLNETSWLRTPPRATSRSVSGSSMKRPR